MAIDQLVERLGEGEHGVAAGWATGAVSALAGATLAGAARGATWALADAASAQAATLAARAKRLGQLDAVAFEEATSALAGEPASGTLGPSLERAAQLPLALAQAAADVAALAAEVAPSVEPERRADAGAAALLASGAATAAAHLVEVNLAVSDRDPRLVEARGAVEAARESSERATAEAV
jgi:hypothetical protein